MTITNRLKLAIKSFSVGNINNPLGAITRNYSKTAQFRPEAQLTGITYKAIDKIGLAVSTYEPQVMRDEDVIENHPFYKFFAQPNPRMNNVDFIYLWAMLHEIYGETFIYKVLGDVTGKVKEIYLLNPAQMEVVLSQGELIGYKLHKDDGKQIHFTPEEIKHDKRPNPFNEWRGMSAMDKASTYIDIEIVTARFTRSYMLNNASPSGVVSLPDMTAEAFKQFAQQWREGYEGPENAGKTAFIRGGEAKFQSVGATLKDIDQKITRDMAKDDVLMMFDLPKGLIGVSGEKGLGRNELEPLEYIFNKYKIDPIMDRLDNIFTEIWQQNQRQSKVKEQPVKIKHVSTIPEDKEFIQKQNKEMVNVAITVNEVRQRMGLPDIEGGDVLVTSNPANQTETKRLVLKTQTKKEIKNEQEDFRAKLVLTNATYEIKVKRAISKFAAKQEYNVINKINASEKSFEEWLFNVKDASEELAELINPIMIELIQAQAEGAKNFITGEVFEMTPEMRAVTSKRIIQIAGLFNDETLKALEKTMADGMASGESLAKIKKRVNQTYSDAKGYRAERIARTESLRTSNSTAEEVYRQNGFTEVEWFINPGACEFCVTYAGRSKTIGTNFNMVGDVITGKDGGQMAISYDDVGTPPLHPNCTCSLIPSR